jgi:hypothetical protein
LRLTRSAATTGAVTGRTFRRDHYLVEVEVMVERGGATGAGATERLEVAVPVEASIPEVGDVVGLEIVSGAAVPLP